MFIEMRILALRRSCLVAAITVVWLGSCDSAAPPLVRDVQDSVSTTGIQHVVNAGDSNTTAQAASASTGDAPSESLPTEVESEPRSGRPQQIAIEQALSDHSAIVELSVAKAEPPDPRDRSNADLSQRNADFPRTYIESIHVDLTSPHHWVRLQWTGPEADLQEIGPFRSSPGSGLGHNNCDDTEESQRNGSNCTPKGENVVEGFSDYLPSVPRCEFVTWFHLARQIAFHSHWQVPHRPASHGCVRLNMHAAQLIHNNARIGRTRVLVDGTWSRW